MFKKLYPIFLYLLISTKICAQAISKQDTAFIEMSVTISTRAEPNRVPLNRTLCFTVQIIWEGNLDDIEIEDVGEPILSNFDIVGTSSSNRVIATSEGKKAVKEIAYTLQPKNLGMGYVESVSVSYKEIQTGKIHYLQIERVAVEVISPVPEENQKNPWWILIIASLLFMGGVWSFFYVRRKHMKSSEKENNVKKIIEEAYLKELKQTINLKEKDKRKAFSILSKLFRRYLSEKYEISALEATTGELLKALSEEKLEEVFIRKCETLFNNVDVVKFSGQNARQNELDEAYTTVEMILGSHLSKSREQIQQMEEENTKKRKKWGKFLIRK
ncbi:hypothetical protein MUP95_09310 [bacterium]|nr:hypothetical protein [bacterium]